MRILHINVVCYYVFESWYASQEIYTQCQIFVRVLMTTGERAYERVHSKPIWVRV
jgi:hypothetical protein